MGRPARTTRSRIPAPSGASGRGPRSAIRKSSDVTPAVYWTLAWCPSGASGP